MTVAPPKIVIVSGSFLEGWEAFSSGSQNEWALDLPGKEKTHKCFGDENSKIRNFNSHFHVFLSKIVASTYGQYGRIFLYDKNVGRGRHSKQDINTYG